MARVRSRRPSPRERVIQLLKEQGFTVEDYYIHVTQGWYRTAQADCIRWSCRVMPPLPAHQQWRGCFSWDTLTDCARHGITITAPGDATKHYDETEYEVSAKVKP